MAEETEFQQKEIFYKGKNLKELKTMDVRESAKFLPARSKRSVLRNFDQIEKFLKRCEKKLSKNKKIKTHSREMVIVPHLVGLTVGVHNGKTFNNVVITAEMIGHRLGEFSMSRGQVKHSSAGIGATKSSRAQKK